MGAATPGVNWFISNWLLAEQLSAILWTILSALLFLSYILCMGRGWEDDGTEAIPRRTELAYALQFTATDAGGLLKIRCGPPATPSPPSGLLLPCQPGGQFDSNRPIWARYA